MQKRKVKKKEKRYFLDSRGWSLDLPVQSSPVQSSPVQSRVQVLQQPNIMGVAGNA